MLGERMGTGPADAKTVERGDVEIAGEIRVGTAAGAFMLEIDPEFAREAFGGLIKRHGLAVRLPDRTRDAARHDETACLVVAPGQRQHAVDATIEIGLPLRHTERLARA